MEIGIAVVLVMLSSGIAVLPWQRFMIEYGMCRSTWQPDDTLSRACRMAPREGLFVVLGGSIHVYGHLVFVVCGEALWYEMLFGCFGVDGCFPFEGQLLIDDTKTRPGL